MNVKSGKGLGRGLDALLGDIPTSEKTDRSVMPDRTLPIEYLAPHKDQPRKIFDDTALDELAESIKARGLLQPILVRPIPNQPDAYEIVAGERRWRAAQRAQLHEVPVIIRDLTDQETAEIALIENVQRVDLNAMEEAEAYAFLRKNFGRKQEDIAKAVGKSRSHVANMLRLLDLPNPVRSALRGGEITMGHARALLSSDDITTHFQSVIRRRLSVRETEKLVTAKASDAQSPDKKTDKPKAGKQKKDADTRALERDLAEGLGLEVDIHHKTRGSGSVTVFYQDLDQLDDVCRRLLGAPI